MSNSCFTTLGKQYLLCAMVLACSNATALEPNDELSTQKPTALKNSPVSPSADLSQQLAVYLSAGEQAAIDSALQSTVEVSRRAETVNGPPYRRDAHAKATACVRATLSINPDIDERFQHSIFSQPGREYKTWVRFSNGDFLVRKDATPDARGMAVKVMGVEGEPIAPELVSNKTSVLTHDLVMTNTKAFFNRNVFDYADNATHFAKFERTQWFIGLFPPHIHPKQLLRAKQTVESVIDTPLAEQYFSMLPYQLGNTVVKFSARPCSGSHYPKTEDKSDPNYLHTAVASHLSTDAACFDVMVQPKQVGADMPIDDATVIWSTEASPYQPIARLHIPPQHIGGEAQAQFCENLSMNPWHGVGEWQPLSSLNRARRVVYQGVSQFRHHKNKAPMTEPDNWCLPNAEQPCNDQQGLIVKKPKWPLPRCFDPLIQPIDGQKINSVCGSGYGSNDYEQSY